MATNKKVKFCLMIDPPNITIFSLANKEKLINPYADKPQISKNKLQNCKLVPECFSRG